MIDENKLIEQAKYGDQDAFSILYKKYYKLLRYIIYDLVKNEETTKDILSSTFLKAYNKLTSYTKPLSFRAWLKTIAVNTAIDYIRNNVLNRKSDSIDKDTNPIQLNDSELDPEAVIINNENYLTLEKALPLLSEKFQKLLYLRYFENCSYEQIGAKLNMPTSTVRSDLYKAKRRLRKIFNKLI